MSMGKYFQNQTGREPGLVINRCHRMAQVYCKQIPSDARAKGEHYGSSHLMWSTRFMNDTIFLFSLLNIKCFI